MRKLVASIVVFFIIGKLVSQPVTTKIGSYEFPKEMEGMKCVSVTMPFGKSELLSIRGDTAELRNAGDIQLDVVCTDFPSASSLSELNKKRIQEFFKIFPYINPNQVIKIEILRQMNGAEKEKAQEMFHGLVIKFRPPQTKETMLHDIAKIDDILEKVNNPINHKKNIDSIETGGEIISTKKHSDTLAEPEKETTKRKIDFIKDTLDVFKDTPRFSIRSKTKLKKIHLSGGISAGVSLDWLKGLGHDSSCYLVLTPKEALKKGLITRKEYHGPGRTGPGIWEIGWKGSDSITILICSSHHKSMITEKDEPYSLRLDSVSITEYSKTPEKYSLPDSTLFKVFGRNKWFNMDIVGDVTGSMYPYTAELLLWLKLQSLDSLTSSYCFFNDGDDLPDHKKKIGKTGGIYSKSCTSFSDVLTLVKTTMEKGGGGDSPENNIEALIEAEKKFPDISFHVLIADNWANIKDISLIKQLTKPVRVVLCGVFYNAINTDYLNLARLTGGSVHLIEDDLFNLAAMHEGEILRIGKKVFKIVDGYFKDISWSVQKNNSL